MVSVKEVTDAIKADKEAVKALALEIAKDPDMQLIILRGVLGSVATKDDIERLKTSLDKLESNMRNNITSVREELIHNITSVREELIHNITSVREELIHYIDKRVDGIQWMVGIGFTILTIIISLTRIL
ncbi:MAG: hypothetical protein QXX95_07420 [Nitrososphaerales archaeon]